jgi:hypothetical protein
VFVVIIFLSEWKKRTRCLDDVLPMSLTSQPSSSLAGRCHGRSRSTVPHRSGFATAVRVKRVSAGVRSRDSGVRCDREWGEEWTAREKLRAAGSWDTSEVDLEHYTVLPCI